MIYDRTDAQKEFFKQVYRKHYKAEVEAKPLKVDYYVNDVGENLARVFDTVLQMGEERTYRLNDMAKFKLIYNNGSFNDSPLFGKQSMNRVKETFAQIKHDRFEVVRQNAINDHAKYSKIQELKNIVSNKSFGSLMANTSDVSLTMPAINADTVINSDFIASSFQAFFNERIDKSTANILKLGDRMDEIGNELADISKKRIGILSTQNGMGIVNATNFANEIGSGYFNINYERINPANDAVSKSIVNKLHQNIGLNPSSIIEPEQVNLFGRFLSGEAGIVNADGAEFNGLLEVLTNGFDDTEKEAIINAYNTNKEVSSNIEKMESFMYDDGTDMGVKRKQFEEYVDLHNKVVGLNDKELQLKQEYMRNSDIFTSATSERDTFYKEATSGNITDDTIDAFAERLENAYKFDRAEPTIPTEEDYSFRPDDLNKMAEEAYDRATKATYEDGVVKSNALELQTLSSDELNYALDNIDDPTLRSLIKAQYQQVNDANGNPIQRPTDFLGLVDIEVGEDEFKYSINGITEIADEGYNINNAIQYLQGYDGYGHVEKLQTESLRLSDGTGLGELSRYIQKYQDEQSQLSVSQKQARFLEVAKGELDKIETPATVAKNIDKPTIPYRLNQLLGGDTALIEPKGAGEVRRRTVPKPEAKAKPQTGLSLVIEKLSKQTDFDDLNFQAKDFQTRTDLFGLFQASLAKGDYANIAASIRSSQNTDYATGAIGQAYKKAMELGNLDQNIPFEALSSQHQQEVAQRMSLAMTDQLEGSLIGLQNLIRDTERDPLLKNMFKAVTEHSAIANSDLIEISNTLRRGTTVDSLESPHMFRENMYNTFEDNKAITDIYDVLYTNMDAQDDIMIKNIGNALRVKDKKDVKAYVAAIKNNYELIEPKDVLKINGRTASHFTVDELRKGSVSVDGNELPLQHFKQFYTMGSMKEIMGEEWKHFSKEEWASGQVKFGETTMPITQFAEYYTTKERKHHYVPEEPDWRMDYEKWWKKALDRQEGRTSNVALSPSDVREWNKYVAAEEVYNNPDSRILVPKQNDPELVSKLNRAKSDGRVVNVKGDVVPYDVSEINNGVAVLKQKHINIADAKVSLNWDGDGDLFTALEQTEDVMRKVTGTNFVDNIGDTNVEKAVTQDFVESLNRPLPGSDNVTRKMLLDRIEYEDGMPKIFLDTARSSFTWMLDKENADELPGLGYITTAKAFADVPDTEIQRALTKSGLDVKNFDMWDNESINNAINDMFAHKIETNLLVSFMIDKSGNGGDRADTAIRVAKNIYTQQGKDATIDDIKAGLLQINNGLEKMESKEAKQYFSVIKDMLGDDSLIREKMTSAADSGTVSLERLSEIMNSEIDRDDWMDAQSSYDEMDMDGLSYGPKKPRTQDNYGALIDSNGDVTKNNELLEIYNQSVNRMRKETYGTDIGIYGINENQLVDGFNTDLMAYRINKNFDVNAGRSRKVNARVGNQEIAEVLEGTLTKLLNNEGVDENIRKAIIEDLPSITKRVVYKNRTTLSSGMGAMNQDVVGSITEQFYQSLAKSKNFPKLTPQMKLDAITGMNKINRGSSEAFVSMNGGIRKVFGQIFGVAPSDVGNLSVINKAFSNLQFQNVAEMRNFARSISDIMPGLQIGVSYLENGKAVSGRVGDYTDATGATDTIVTLSGGEKRRLVNGDEESLRFIGLGEYDAKDIMLGKENVARQHASAYEPKGSTKAVAGFIGNYDMITRRAGYNTSGMDPISTFNLLNQAKEDGMALMFDFETTGLPDRMPDGAFAPIEFSYAEFDFDKKKILKRDVTSMYARPNESVKTMFNQAQSMDAFDFAKDIPTDRAIKIGSDDSMFSLLKNYSKYDTGRIKLGDKSYTWGGLTNAKMMLGAEGTLMAELNGEMVDTLMTPDQMIAQTKKSANAVFNYLQEATPTSKKRFGIDPSMIFNETDFIDETQAVFDDYRYLMGHNISAADVPWFQSWSARAGRTGHIGLEERTIDTQDLLQASNSGRRFNNLEQFSNNSTKSHLAYADVMTNGELVRKLLRDKQVNAIMGQVDRGIQPGDLIMKNAVNHMGMGEIEAGLYKLGAIDGASINLIPIGIDGSEGKAVSFKADNKAILKKELADNWSNFENDLELAIATNNARVQSSTNRTFFNGMYNGAMDRYEYFGKHGNFDLQKSLLSDFQQTHENFQSSALRVIEDANTGRFSSRTDNDLAMFIQSNSNRLTNNNDGYTKELRYLNDLKESRLPEMKRVADYLGTDEGQRVKGFLENVGYRNSAGIYTNDMREKLGKNAYDAIATIKRNAVQDGILGQEFMMDVPGKYKVGTLTFGDLSPDMKQHLHNLEPYFNDKDLFISLDSAERVKSDIFKMGDDIAKKIVGMENVKDLNTARQRVVNEVILPKLTSLSNNADLNEAILTRKITDTVNDDYKNAVYTMASEIVANRQKLKNELPAMQVLNMSKALDPSVPQQAEVLSQIDTMLKSLIDAQDFEVMSLPNPIPDAPDKRVAIEGGQEIIDKMVEVQKANKARYLELMRNSSTYQKYLEQGIDPIAEGINPFPMWDMSLENSAGKAISGVLHQPIEYRITSSDKKKWMQMKSAKELKDIMDQLPTQTNVDQFGAVFEAFANNTSYHVQQQARHRQNNADIIEFMQEKMGGKDISHIRKYNEEILKWKDEYKAAGKFDIQGNRTHRAEIARELWKRADMKDYSYNAPFSGNTISTDRIKSNPTKYNAMKEIGLMQQAEDGRFYTGQIGLGSFVDGETLDPSKIIIPGNAGHETIDAVTREAKKVGINQYAGLPLTALTAQEVGLVADNKTATYNKDIFKDYYDRLMSLSPAERKNYNDIAMEIQQAINKQDRQLKRVKLHELVPEYTQSLGDTSYIAGVNKGIKESVTDSASKKTQSQFAENLNTITNTVTDSPLYQTVKGNLDGVSQFLNQHKKGIGIGAAVLAVAGALKLTSPKSSNGRTAEQSPQSNQAPTVDGQYDKEYNKHEGSRGFINPQSKTIRLEENGKGLAVRARGKNRRGIDDVNIDSAVSDTMQSTMGANVRINHTDDRTSIDKNYVQGLVSNALFS